MTDQSFEQGDVLEIRGYEYVVERVDITHRGEVIQYDIESEDGPTARLEPTEDGTFVFVAYHEVEDVEVKSDD